MDDMNVILPVLILIGLAVYILFTISSLVVQIVVGYWNAYDNSYNGGGDIVVTKLNAAGSALLFSTFVGGTGSDMGFDITLDLGNNVYVVGNTYSSNFPT